MPTRGRTSQWSGIARVVDRAPWRTPDQLVAERNARPLHEQSYGQTLPVFMGAAPVEGVVFWKDGPHITTTTDTNTTSETELVTVATPWSALNSWGTTTQRVYTTTTTTTTTVRASFAVAHSFNQFQRAGELLKVEFDDVVIFDAVDGTALPNGITMRVYDGIDNGFDPAMVAKDGAALTPAYHGVRYLFFDDIDLALFEGAIPASIRILWGDTVTASSSPSTLPLLATAANGYQQSFPWLCFDGTLNRFYNEYKKTGDTSLYIGVTDFAAGREISLNKLSGAPSPNIVDVYGACALFGTGLFVCTAVDNPFTNYSDLLVDADTGVVRASQQNGTGDEVEWWAALPLRGSSESKYIVAGRILQSTTGGGSVFAFALVNASSPSISYLEYGTGQAANNNSRLTPGFSDSSGTVFYMSTGGTGGTLYEVRFSDAAAPTYTQIYTVGAGEIIDKIYYDSSSNAVVITVDTGSTVARRIDPSDGSVFWEITADVASNGPQVVPGGGAWFDLLTDTATHRLRPGYALMRDAGLLYLLNVKDGSFTEIEATGFGPAGFEIDHYDQYTSKVYALETDVWQTNASALYTAGTVTLADELTTFSKYDDARGGLLTDIQVTTVGLAGIINGGVYIDTDTDLRELASRLAEIYGVQRVETATGVKWVKKATDGAYVADIVFTESDLVDERSGDAVVKIATRDRNPKEIPAEIEFRYISSDAGYEPLPARAAWPQGVFDTALSLLKRSLSVPVVLTDQQALELAWGLLARERAANKTHSLKLRPNRLKVEPSDIFELTAGGQSIVGMFTKQTKHPDHVLDMTAEGYLSRAATTVVAESPIVHVEPTPRFTTLHVFLDGPLLRSLHDGGGVQLIGYSVLTGLDGWLGGSLYRRREGESTWTKVAETGGALPVVGVLTEPLPASPWPFETDTDNELTFRVVYGDAGDIAAQTESQFYEAAGILAVGAPGRWNFVTWRNKTVNADGTITLDTLRQGLKGSETYEGTSQTGDRVVLVKVSQALLVPYDLADLNTSVEMKAVAFGVDPNGVTASRFTVSGAADTPRAPGNLDAVIAGSDIGLTWDRRSRLLVDSSGTFGDGTDAPLGADLDVYQVDIVDGPGGAVLRTYSDVSGEAKTYGSADITADFGAIPNNLTFRVAQKTSITGIGYGYVAERSIALQ